VVPLNEDGLAVVGAKVDLGVHSVSDEVGREMMEVGEGGVVEYLGVMC